jgi:N-acetyl-1-D-myo-inositol-2-amino-2-deoxy-alpha-D-glucopyranoside deacetylase
VSVPDLPARRALFVHAHPDDETIASGSTMARYAAAGDHVTLVTCTLGEEGEIHVPALAGLAAAEADQLGGYRLVELERACAALGVTDHRLLGGAGRYRDSGMMGLDSNKHPRAFWVADLDEAAGYLLEIIREVRPQVVVTYDPNGGYGHPDHIQTHRATMLAVELATAEGIGPAKVYWTAVPRSVLEAGIEQFSSTTDNPFAGITNVDDIPFVVPDERIAARIDATDFAGAKLAAAQAYPTQIPPTSWLFSLISGNGSEFMGIEYYELVVGERGPAAGNKSASPGGSTSAGNTSASPGGSTSAGPNNWEDDLFAGLTVAP